MNKILYAKHNGTYVLKFIGEVRVSVCSAIDAFFDVMFADSTLDSVLVDLSETRSIDSTGLGLIVKIAVQLQQFGGVRPTILSTNDDITQLLYSMSLDQVFTIITTRKHGHVLTQADLIELAKTPDISEPVVTRKVLEAHRLLMDLSEENKETFKDVVSILEEQQARQA